MSVTYATLKTDEDSSVSFGGPYQGGSKNIFRAPNGIIWAMQDKFGLHDGSGEGVARLWYSENDGVSWYQGQDIRITGAQTPAGYGTHQTWFIDIDGYAHFMYYTSGAARWEYRRGTLSGSAGARVWNLSTPITIVSMPKEHQKGFTPSFVVHREGTGWALHMVYQRVADVGTALVAPYDSTPYYRRYGITSSGTITQQADFAIGGTYRSSAANSLDPPFITAPMIDFHHTGDGLTVKDGTPHLYTSWKTPLGELKYKHFSYSGGTWTPGVEQTIHTDNSSLSSTDNTQSAWAWYDGVRWIYGHRGSSGASIMLYEYTLSNQTMFARKLASSGFGGYSGVTRDYLGNVYFGMTVTLFGKEWGFYKFDRATNTTWGKFVRPSSPPSQNAGDLWFQWLPSPNNKMTSVFGESGFSSPYQIRSVTWDVSATSPTTKPTLVFPAGGRWETRTQNSIIWQNSSEAVQNNYNVIRRLSAGTTSYTNDTVALTDRITYAANTIPDETVASLAVSYFDGSIYGPEMSVASVLLSSWWYSDFFPATGVPGNAQANRMRILRSDDFEKTSINVSNYRGWSGSGGIGATVPNALKSYPVAEGRQAYRGQVTKNTTAAGYLRTTQVLSAGGSYNISMKIYIPSGFNRDVSFGTEGYYESPVITQRDEWVSLDFNFTSPETKEYPIGVFISAGPSVAEDQYFYIDAVEVSDNAPLEEGEYEYTIQTFNYLGVSPPASPTSTLTLTSSSNTFRFDGGLWVPYSRKVFDGTLWKDHLVQKL